jgi:putative DNA topoisomerase
VTTIILIEAYSHEKQLSATLLLVINQCKILTMKKLLIILIATFATFTSFAQKAKGNIKTANTIMTIQSNYRCPMHADVVSNEQGKCSKCNRDLVMSKKEQMKKEVMRDYAYPMHKEVVSDMAGTCAKCGSALVVVDRKGSKQGNISYVCSMHPGSVADKAGKCPICGMDLTKANSEVAPKKG